MEMVNNGPRLYMLIGVPGSGKSTFVKNMSDFGENSRGKIARSFFVASTDSRIENMARDMGTTYNELFKDAIKFAEMSMYEDISTWTKYNRDIIWDQTNLTKKSRAKKLAKIPAHYHKIAVVFETPSKEELQRRLDGRAGFKDIPEHVMKRMIETFESPTLEEGFDEIIPHYNN